MKQYRPFDFGVWRNIGTGICYCGRRPAPCRSREAKTKMMMGGGRLPLTQDKNTSNDGHTTGKVLHNSYLLSKQ